MLYIYIYICIYINIHAYTHIYIYICITLYLYHMRGIYIIAHFCPISWWCRKLNSRSTQIAPQLFCSSTWPLLDGHDPGAFRHTHIDLWFERCSTVTCGAFLTWWESWQKVDDSRKPSKTAAAWSFRRAFHSAPKSFLTFWIVDIVVPFIYAQAGTHATLTSSRGGKSIGPSTVVCQTRNLNQGQSSCEEAEGQGQKILGMPIRNHVSPARGMRNRYSVNCEPDRVLWERICLMGNDGKPEVCWAFDEVKKPFVSHFVRDGFDVNAKMALLPCTLVLSPV